MPGDDAARHLGFPRALIFDMDGTMVDSMPAHGRAGASSRKRHGIEMPIAEILRRTTGRNGVECIRELFGPTCRMPARWN
jgi:beta-phosphoglucomutase-like phosphatase (HAD superfamily)